MLSVWSCFLKLLCVLLQTDCLTVLHHTASDGCTAVALTEYVCIQSVVSLLAWAFLDNFTSVSPIQLMWKNMLLSSLAEVF